MTDRFYKTEGHVADLYARQLVGGGSLPIVTTKDGTFLETTELEGALGSLFRQLGSVQAQRSGRRPQQQQQPNKPGGHGRGGNNQGYNNNRRGP